MSKTPASSFKGTKGGLFCSFTGPEHSRGTPHLGTALLLLTHTINFLSAGPKHQQLPPDPTLRASLTALG